MTQATTTTRSPARPAPASASAPLITATGQTLVLAATGPAPARRVPERAGPFAPYRRLLATPGARGFTTGNLIARLPIGMFGVSAVMMIAGQRGSYALAGAVAATGLAATAVVAPWTARLIDRHGQARIALPATLVAVLGALALVLCVRRQAPDWTLFACYAATAATPNIGGMSRARWTHLLRGDAKAHHTAMSFEQAADEACYMFGPVLAAFLCTALFPEAGTLAGAALLLTGMLVFTAQRDTEPPVSPAVHHGSPLRTPGMRPLLVLFLALGALFGSMEIASIGYLDERGLGAASGLILALQAAGSCIAGLVYGTLRPKSLRTCVLALAVAMTLPATAVLTGLLPLLGCALLVAGMATAPTMVTAMSLVQRLTPPDRLNEGMTVAVTAILAGIAGGSAAGGWLVEHLGPAAAYGLPVAAALTALAVSRRPGR
ncbi:MFS transporter [Streptomyces venezuelae]|uniref:MFS transporter n=1 Tax=Streptomyces venezuelae TaxID=54571 RepID=A0A5P2D156_STRVZ|nr:MFS transporter [Streptomyces venezuelae]QES48493.1 MFS transporter [Streptomyces venezuelae]